MEGVTILNTFEIVERAPGWTWWALIPIAFTIFFIALAIWCITDVYGEIYIIPSFLAGVGLAVSLVVCLTAKELPPETHYNVIVDESVSFAEFNEKYEVIDQEGLIYTVIEKE
jgi:hypothetical protein